MIELSANAEADPTQTLLDGADTGPLFSPATIAGLRLKNRWVMAPMTRQFSPDGIPGADVAAYYGRRAASLGLLVTEGTYVDESAGPSDRVPRFFGASSLAGWRKVADAVHAADGAIFPQLWHLGAGRKPGTGPYPDAPVISPSGIDAAGGAVAGPATAAQLATTAASFAAPPPRRRRPGSTGSNCTARTVTCSTSSTGRHQPAHRRLRR